MNITLSADGKLIKRSREYALRHHTTLNNLIREYLKKISDSSLDDSLSAGESFMAMTQSYAGESSPDYHFNRDELYDRKNTDE
ncbi:MAG: hypothetical protein KAQ69_06690 [Spirochaetales bacterium]|nr:hypothetical protein [Spirochaetales bacterium]